MKIMKNPASSKINAHQPPGHNHEKLGLQLQTKKCTNIITPPHGKFQFCRFYLMVRRAGKWGCSGVCNGVIGILMYAH